MKLQILFVLLLSIAGFTGFAEQLASATATTQPHADCLFCKYNADLACVDVAVDASTPRATYDGKAYYFCSDQCRSEFAKDPQHYLKH
ncbi:hypothetical protein BH10PLA1_BH10PLA1_17650 [soil metagenome]